jgi:hypothetical protein
MKDKAEDLFDKVNLPKAKAQTEDAPQAPATMREAAPAQPQQRAGAPLSRLLWLVVPLLLTVAAVALWSVSVWLLVIAAGAVAAGLIVTALIRHWQRRRTGSASRAGQALLSSSRPGARTGLRRFGPGRSGSGRGALGRSGGGRSGSGRTGRGLGGLGTGRGRGTGSGRGLFRRGPGRSGTGAKGTSAQGRTAPVGAGARTGRRGGRLGSLFTPGRRRTGTGAARTGTGRASGTGRPGRTAGAAGLRGGRWTTSRANPATWGGQRRRAAQAIREATKSKRRGKPRAKKTDPQQSKDTTATPRKRWLRTWRAKTYTSGGEPITAPKPDAAPKAKGQNTNAKQQNPSKATPSTKSKPGDDFLFDDGGFPSGPPPKPAAKPKPTPQPLNVDDGGFPSPVITKEPKAKRSKPPRRSVNIMTDRTTNTAATQIDASSPETFRATTKSAADDLRRSAGRLDEEAEALLRQAQSWVEKGEISVAEGLKREAAGMKQDASQRLAAAAAYEDAAAAAK